jgi:hypothetical protein
MNETSGFIIFTLALTILLMFIKIRKLKRELEPGRAALHILALDKYMINAGPKPVNFFWYIKNGGDLFDSETIKND